MLNTFMGKCSLIAVACSLSLSAYAVADTRARLAVPAGGLVEALKELARQSDIELIYQQDQLKNLKTEGLNGSYSPQEAIDILLRGTTLHVYSAGSGAMVIAPTAPGKEAAGRMPVKDRLRVAQVDTASIAGASPDGVEPSRTRDSLEEVVVTAQKREERLIDVPQSVSVLSADDLTRIGALQFRDYADTIPGMAYNTNGAGYTQIVLRGVTTGYESSAPVAVYIDEVPMGASGVFSNGTRMALDAALFDLERIEVLRGPQGTLYGAGAVGGLVKYVTKVPSTTKFNGLAQAGLSSTEHGGMSYTAAGAVNIPLSLDTAAVRVSGFYSHDGGYIDNVALGQHDVNQSNVYSGRADLLLTPTDKLKLRIAAFAQDIHRDGEGTSDYNFNGQPLVKSLESVRPIAEPFDQKLRTISATLNYDFGAAQLTSISSYESRDSIFYIDATPLYQLFFPDYSGVNNGNTYDQRKFVQEVRLSGQGRLVDWVIGGYYTTEDNQERRFFVLRDLAGQPTPNNLSTAYNPYDFDEYAAFGTVTWHITDKLDASGGVRYSKNHQSYEQNGVGLVFGTAPRASSNGDATTYLANVRYSITDQSTIYARYATGYRPGGPNISARDLNTGQPLVGLPPAFDADMLDSYEIGYKGETQDRHWGIDVAAYYIDWDNIAIGVFDAASGISYYDNAAGMKVKGGELALTARPIDRLSIVSSFTYTDSYLTEANASLGAAKGERMPTVPRYLANLSADYTFDGGWRPTIGASFRNIGDRHASFDQSPGFPQYILPSYSSLDLRAGLDVNQYNIRLYVRNVLDERGELAAYTWQGNPRPALLQPRTVGLTVTTQF